MKKQILALGILLTNALYLNAQQWSGSSTTTGDITRTGNVGIGTLTPSANLHNAGRLSGGASFKIGMPNQQGTIAVPYGASTGAYDIDFYGYRDVYPDQIGVRIRAERINSYVDNSALVQSMDLAFSTSTGMLVSDLSEKMRIKSNGNVGIGTTNPSDKLTVAGSARILNGANVYLQAPTGSTNDPGDFVFTNSSGTELSRFYYLTGSGFVFSIGSTPTTKLLLNDNGELGINTSNTQGYKLAVNGSAIFTKAVVKPNANWPDYVFEPKYKLPSLQSLEAFTKVNKHLPDMPTADEINKNGIDLGQNQTLLLKKVEELTLYLIDQNKKQETQQALINQQNVLLLEQQTILKKMQEELNKLKENNKK